MRGERVTPGSNAALTRSATQQAPPPSVSHLPKHAPKAQVPRAECQVVASAAVEAHFEGVACAARARGRSSSHSGCAWHTLRGPPARRMRGGAASVGLARRGNVQHAGPRALHGGRMGKTVHRLHGGRSTVPDSRQHERFTVNGRRAPLLVAHATLVRTCEEHTVARPPFFARAQITPRHTGLHSTPRHTGLHSTPRHTGLHSTRPPSAWSSSVCPTSARAPSPPSLCTSRAKVAHH
eukprot:365762-Chlamydomonas_euryale.AAC.1